MLNKKKGGGAREAVKMKQVIHNSRFGPNYSTGDYKI